ncbi:hypothetical protein LEP1GSC072_3711 [Leptospira noguchii str. Bonito]|nr:hypothetical protein LEP1GSC072_3711 [Leptospira noguchii str. Bonito]
MINYLLYIHKQNRLRLKTKNSYHTTLIFKTQFNLLSLSAGTTAKRSFTVKPRKCV